MGFPVRQDFDQILLLTPRRAALSLPDQPASADHDFGVIGKALEGLAIQVVNADLASWSEVSAYLRFRFV